ncbi:MAG: prepilin-type N-terminal cleavage/methylation domain-containing protein [Rhodospirillaceae bacterium]|nr:prepilin-type N-terminal cleavage/methylation domain-containing protein [Rhodospirillaceae bacterium]
MATADKRRGFTLVEVLVVLVITSLVSVVLMQGLGLILNLQDNLGAQLTDIQRAIIQRNTVLQPLQGVVADFSEGEFEFKGNQTAVAGLTTLPLLRSAGRPTPFSIEIAYDERNQANTLIYREDNDPAVALLTWEGQRASFRYIGDSQTGWASEWPPKLSALAMPGQITEVRPPQLPELIYLDTASEEVVDLAAAVLTRRNRVSRDPPAFIQ